MHPGHLPTRYIANFAFYREGFDRAAARLRAYLTKAAGAVMDEPATARALARYLYRGYVCGAVDRRRADGRAPAWTPTGSSCWPGPKSDTENVAVAARS